MMEYTNLILFAAGMLGVLTHTLMKIDKLNRKTNGAFNFNQFIKIEWASLMLSAIVVVVAIIARTEISQLKAIGSWLALGFYAIGLSAQSVAYFVKGKAEKNLSDNNSNG